LPTETRHPNGKALDRSLRLRTPIAVCRYGDFAHGVSFDTRIGHVASSWYTNHVISACSSIWNFRAHAAAVSKMRLAKPHSLSNQRQMLPSPSPWVRVWVPSISTELGVRLRSVGVCGWLGYATRRGTRLRQSSRAAFHSLFVISRLNFSLRARAETLR